MNLLLELVRHRINRWDDPRAYALAVRRHIEEHEGQPPSRYRDITDPARWDTTEERWVRTTSLRA